MSSGGGPPFIPVPDRISPVSQSDFSSNYGGSLVCCMVMILFYGISLLQGWLYFINYPKDVRWMKIVVAVLLLGGTVHTAFVCYNIWHYVILSYSDPMLLAHGTWMVYGSTLLSIWTIFAVEVFFARTVYQLTKNTWRIVVTTFLGLLILAQVVIGTILSVRLIVIWELPLIHVLVYPYMVPMFVLRVVCDAVIATTLCVALYDSRTGFDKTLKLVRVLMMYAMNRFVLTAVVVLAQTITLLVNPRSLATMNIEFVTVHLYVNSVLATLNSRNHLRELGTNGRDYISGAGTGSGTYVHSNLAAGTNNSRAAIIPRKVDWGVNVESETITMSDVNMHKV